MAGLLDDFLLSRFNGMQGGMMGGQPPAAPPMQLQGAQPQQGLLGGLQAMLQQIAQPPNPQADREFAFRQQEAMRQQANQDRAFRLQQELGLEKPTVQFIEDASGNKVPMLIKPMGAGVKQLPVEGQDASGGNPYAYGKQNENQAKEASFANRMFRAEGILRDPAVEGAAKDPLEYMKSKTPIVGNFLTSADFQKYDQAARDFINAQLRRESGAAINQSEFDNAYKQYMPYPGDKPERLAEKRRNRQDAIAGVAGGAGQAYKPQFTFGPGGEMVPTGAPMQGATPAGKMPAAGVTTGPNPPPSTTAVQALRQELQAGRDRRAEFDARYGAGAAARALGQ